MRRRVTSILLTGAAAASALVLGAAPAVAQTTISIENPNADGHYTATSDLTVLTDFDTTAQFTCETETNDEDGDGIPGEPASTAGGTISNATNEALPFTVNDNTSADDHAVESLVFNNCTSSFGAVDVDAVPPNDPYDLIVETHPGHLADGSAADGVGRVVSSTGTAFAQVSVSFCSFDVIGEAPGAYRNASNPANGSGTGQLVLDPDLDPAETGATGLTAANVSSCFGQVNNGDSLGYDAVYDIDDPTSPSIEVTSP